MRKYEFWAQQGQAAAVAAVLRQFGLQPRIIKGHVGRRVNLGQSWLTRAIGVDATTIRLWVKQGRPSEIGERLIQHEARPNALAA